MSDLICDIHKMHDFYNRLDTLDESELDEFEALIASVEKRVDAVYAGQQKAAVLSGAAFRPRGFLNRAD